MLRRSSSHSEGSTCRMPMSRVREGTYQLADGREIYFQDGSTYRDLSDLYSVLSNQKPDGTINLENAQVESLATQMLSGYPLSDVEIGVLRKLLAKYNDRIAAL